MASIELIREMSMGEKEFQRLFPSMFKRYFLYAKYYNIATGHDIQKDKDYNTILIKSLIAYFLYQEKVYNKKLTNLHIANLMNYKDHTGILYAIKRIKYLLQVQPKYKVFDKTIREYFLIFNGIFYRNKNKKNEK